MDLPRLIDELKFRQALRNDAQAATYLGISRAGMSKIRAGGGIGDEVATRLAEGLGKDAGEFLIEVHAAQAKDTKTRRAWEKLLGRVATLFPVALLLAEAGRSASQYILCKIDTAPKITA